LHAFFLALPLTVQGSKEKNISPIEAFFAA
jgi:hypothetical protein